MTLRRGIHGLLLALVIAAPAVGAVEEHAFVRAPVLLFISGANEAVLPVPVAQVRTETVARLEAALITAGADVIPNDRLLPHLAAHRVRSTYGLSPEFLADLQAGTGANHLLAAVLLAYHGRIQLLARLIDLDDGRVVWAACDEQVLTGQRTGDLPESVDWFTALARITGRCRPLPAATGPASAVVLPARAVACNPEVAVAATHAVLASLCEQGTSVVDPGVAATVLAEAGIPYLRLDADGRRLLAGLVTGGLLAVPEIMVYATAAGSSSARAAAEDGLPGGLFEAPVLEYELSVQVIDAGTGTVVAHAARHRTHGLRVGWFGVQDKTTVLGGLNLAAREIHAALILDLEDR
jgi:hypothetical protein